MAKAKKKNNSTFFNTGKLDITFLSLVLILITIGLVMLFSASYAYSYEYAYGWVIAPEGSKETLYQIPVIKITDLEYGYYSVVITPTFTSGFGHSSVAADGTNYYRVYLDAIKI